MPDLKSLGRAEFRGTRTILSNRKPDRHLTFATAGCGTTQLFINLADNRNLDRMGFAPFGKVVEGMDVVQQFYSGYGEGAPGTSPDQAGLPTKGNPISTRISPCWIASRWR